MAKKEIVEKPHRVMRTYRDEELRKFHDLVQKYYFDYVIKNGRSAGVSFKMLDRKKLMIAFGALTPSGAVAYDEVEDRATRYQEFENVFEQWASWNVRTGLDKGFAERAKLKQLDQIAQEKTIEPEPSDLDF